MKNTITINQENNTQHIIHLDQKQVPLTIKPLPQSIAYQIQDTPILTTTTQTLQNMHITTIRQKNKNILTQTTLIIIQNTKTLPTLQIQTIQENPQINIHTTTPTQLPQLLKKLTEKHNTPTTIQENADKTYTLTQQDKTIKTYHNKKYVKHIQDNINNNTHLTLQEAEYRAQKQYYKNISYDKTNQTYKITIKNKTSQHKKLTHAIQEQNTIQNDQEQDEETLCQNNHTSTQPLPPTPWNNTLHKLHYKKQTRKYQTTKQKNNRTTTHNNPDAATYIIKQHLQQHEITRIRNTQKPDRNIKQKNNKYHITKIKDKKLKTYYKTRDKNLARYIRDKLEEKEYKLTNEEIQEHEKEYTINKETYKKTYNEQHKIIDYYKQTQTKLKTKQNTKEQYQQKQIHKHQ